MWFSHGGDNATIIFVQFHPQHKQKMASFQVVCLALIITSMGKLISFYNFSCFSTLFFDENLILSKTGIDTIKYT